MASSRSRTRLSSLILANILIPFAVLVFATGFFPYKPFLSGLATFEEVENEEHGLGLLSKDARPERVFDKVIFMVVDALRSDFVYGHDSGFVFTQSLIRTGAAVPFTAHAAPPTVTMPRVKGLTSGSVPSFLDLILNFAESDTSSSLATQDTWLAQIKAHLHSENEEEGKIVFYGDDTWLKLFPNYFARADGTTSFFVSDFTEVDNNVTRHIPHEMEQPDWNAMIMHYLGLDHIGHKSGPLSPNMIPKQKEMDGIVEMIYKAIGKQSHLENTLLVLAGDHGMNSAGNHGGSAAGETSPALVFISPKLREITCGSHAIESAPGDEDFNTRLGIQPPLSAAAFFALEQKRKLSNINGGAAQDGLVEYLTQIWDAMKPEDKAIFESLALRDQLRYQKDVQKATCEDSVAYKAPTEPKADTEFDYYRRIEQSDLVPTLAALLGIPVSRNNLGIVLPEMLKFWQKERQGNKLRHDHQLLYRNSLQMLRILKAAHGDAAFDGVLDGNVSTDRLAEAKICDDMMEGVEQLSCKWRLVKYSLSNAEGDDRNDILSFVLVDFLSTAQDALSAAASSYDVPRLVAGAGVAILATTLAVLSKKTLWAPSTASVAFTVIIVLYGVMMFATSYVEEEQHFWYWLTSGWTLILYFIQPTATSTSVTSRATSSSSSKSAALAAFFLLASHRLITHWNQTGQKHAGAPDIAHHFFPSHHILLWILALATYAHLGIRFATRTFHGFVMRELSAMTALSLTLPSLVFKLNFTQADAPELVKGLAAQLRAFTAGWDLVLQARATFMGIGIAAIALILLSWLRGKWIGEDDEEEDMSKVVSLPQRLHDLLTLFLVTQTRVQNIPLFLLFELQLQMMYILLTAPSPSSFLATTTASELPREPTTSAMAVKTQQKTQGYAPPPILAASVSILLMTYTAYFALGGSNAISSLDLSNAYNGISGYNVLAVGVLLFASNWAGAIWWSLGGVLLIHRLRDGLETRDPAQGLDAENAKEKEKKEEVDRKRRWIEMERSLLLDGPQTMAKPVSEKKVETKKTEEGERGLWIEHLATMTIFVCAGLVAVMAACTVLRTHLFIWTVFSPKYLYAMAWSLGWHFGINVVLGSVLYRLGRR